MSKASLELQNRTSMTTTLSEEQTTVEFFEELQTNSKTTVVCIKVHKIVSVWCKIALGEVGVSLP